MESSGPMLPCSSGSADALPASRMEENNARHLGYLRDFLAEGDCSARVVE